ncbi:alpha-xylosidase, partial [Halobacteriales archaeon SW_12_71_31]
SYTSFESMGASLRGGLSLGLSGYQFWSVDIGGFRGEPSPELYVRWAQWGLLGTSHSRFHGTTPREPWEFGEEAASIVTRYIRERYRLLPYLYSCAAHASESGLPVMRPLVLEFQHDPAVWNEDTELLLGEALLVAPVLRPDDNRTVYLPEGEWVDYWTNERYEGQQSIHLTPDLDTLPLFVRAGRVIPRRESIQSVSLADEPPDLDLRVELPSTEVGGADHDAQSATDDRRSASFEYYNDTLEAVQEIRVVSTPESALELSFPTSTPVESATIRPVEQRPDAVEVNDVQLSPVNADP